MQYAMAVSSSASNASMLFSSQLKNSPSRITPIPDDLSQSGSELALRQDFQTVKINYHGNRLPEGANHVLPRGWFTAVLPPTDESTCDNRVVGTG